MFRFPLRKRAVKFYCYCYSYYGGSLSARAVPSMKPILLSFISLSEIMSKNKNDRVHWVLDSASYLVQLQLFADHDLEDQIYSQGHGTVSSSLLSNACLCQGVKRGWIRKKGLKSPVFSVHDCERRNIAILPGCPWERQWAPFR